MRTIPEVSPGDRIRASDLNRLIQFAGGPYANAIPQHGIAYANSQYLNASSDDRHSQMLLVQAMEDFVEQVTDHLTVDDVPSGKCRRVELNQQTNQYEAIGTEQNDFWVHDPIAGFSGATAPVVGNRFHVQWNPNSKRWEVAATGVLKPIEGVTVACLGGGWYTVELGDFLAPCPGEGGGSGSGSGSGSDSGSGFESGSGSGSGSGSDSSDSSGGEASCDPCIIFDIDDPETQMCDQVAEVEVPRDRPEGKKIFVCAHDTRTLPLKVPGHVRVVPMGIDADGDPYYAVISGEYNLLSIPIPDWECCDGEVVMTSCKILVVEGAYCEGYSQGCPSDGSESSGS